MWPLMAMPLSPNTRVLHNTTSKAYTPLPTSATACAEAVIAVAEAVSGCPRQTPSTRRLTVEAVAFSVLIRNSPKAVEVTFTLAADA